MKLVLIPKSAWSPGPIMYSDRSSFRWFSYQKMQSILIATLEKWLFKKKIVKWAIIGSMEPLVCNCLCFKYPSVINPLRNMRNCFFHLAASWYEGRELTTETSTKWELHIAQSTGNRDQRNGIARQAQDAIATYSWTEMKEIKPNIAEMFIVMCLISVNLVIIKLLTNHPRSKEMTAYIEQ